MSIKPIDFQVMLPKSYEVSKVQNDIQFRNEMANQQQALEAQKNALNNTRTVHAQDNINKSVIKDKQERNKFSKEKENTKHKKKDKSDDKKQSPIQAGTIDIRL